MSDIEDEYQSDPVDDDDDDNLSIASSLTSTFEDSKDDIDLPAENPEDEEHENELESISSSKIYNLSTQNSTRTQCTSEFLSKYEFTKVIGVRAEQISLGAKINIETKSFEPLVIAREELLQSKINMIIRRTLPNKQHEDCNVKDLKVLI